VGQLDLGESWHDPECAFIHLRAPTGGCRPTETRASVAQVEQVHPLFYFHARHFSLWQARTFLWAALRRYVLNKAISGSRGGSSWQPDGICTEPGEGIRLAAGPPRDLTFTHPGLVQSAREMKSAPVNVS